MKKELNELGREWLFLLSYAPDHKAGAGLSTLEFARYLAKNGIRPTILTLNRRCREKSFEKNDDVSIYRIPYLNQNLITKLFSMLWIQAWYLIYCIKNRVIIIVGGKTIGLEVMLFWCWLLRRKTIFRSTNMGIDDLHSILNTNLFFGSIRKFLYSKINIYYSLNPVFTENFRQYFTGKIKVFESVQGVNLKRFFKVSNEEKNRFRIELDIPEKALVFITLGVLTYRKGFPELIQYLSNIKTDFIWLVLGEKDFGKNHFLENKMPESFEIQKLGNEKLGKKVSFLGWTNQPERYLKAADIFLLGGTREGIPNACLQAMSCGLPALVRNNPGYTEMLGAAQNTVLLYNEEIDFLSKLTKLISSQSYYNEISSNAAAFAEKNFRYEEIFSGLTNLLEEKQ